MAILLRVESPQAKHRPWREERTVNTQRNVTPEVHVVFGEETAFWNANRQELSVRYPGKWLLIRGSEVIGAFGTFSQAAQVSREMNVIALIQPVEPGMAKDTILLPSVYAVG